MFFSFLHQSLTLGQTFEASFSSDLSRKNTRGSPHQPRSEPLAQLFYSFFKTLVGKEIAVELKNDVALTGTLHSVDQYLNVKLTDVHVVEAERYPQLVSARYLHTS